MESLKTLGEMADTYRVSRQTFAKWVRLYRLPVVRVNGRVLRFDRGAVDAALRRIPQAGGRP
jgi:excisionase family DNA binding protein